jgi:hypothetical protein
MYHESTMHIAHSSTLLYVAVIQYYGNSVIAHLLICFVHFFVLMTLHDIVLWSFVH